jgi:hypothetical protein
MLSSFFAGEIFRYYQLISNRLINKDQEIRPFSKTCTNCGDWKTISGKTTNQQKLSSMLPIYTVHGLRSTWIAKYMTRKKKDCEVHEKNRQQHGLCMGMLHALVHACRRCNANLPGASGMRKNVHNDGRYPSLLYRSTHHSYI